MIISDFDIILQIDRSKNLAVFSFELLIMFIEICCALQIFQLQFQPILVVSQSHIYSIEQVEGERDNIEFYPCFVYFTAVSFELFIFLNFLGNNLIFKDFCSASDSATARMN